MTVEQDKISLRRSSFDNTEQSMQSTRAPDNKNQDVSELKGSLRELFHAQSLAVVATLKKEQPFTNLVAFVATDDLRHLVFATSRATRKYENLKKNPRVSMTIDNRQNMASDFSDATAVMAVGVAEEVTGSERRSLEERYLKKHPYLQSFISAPSCALIKVQVIKYDIVQRFQNVVELECSHGCGSVSSRSQ